VYYGLNPWGPERADLNAGMIAATVANGLSTNGGFAAEDFMPTFGPPPEQSMDEMKAACIRIAAMFG
jgi:hypothetical protein